MEVSENPKTFVLIFQVVASYVNETRNFKWVSKRYYAILLLSKNYRC